MPDSTSRLDVAADGEHVPAPPLAQHQVHDDERDEEQHRPHDHPGQRRHGQLRGYRRRML